MGNAASSVDKSLVVERAQKKQAYSPPLGAPNPVSARESVREPNMQR